MDLTVSAGLVTGLLSFAAASGVDRARLLRRAHVREQDLEDHDRRIPARAYEAMMREAKRLSADPALALHFAERVDMSEVSILGLIMNASLTMGEAFSQLQRYHRLAVEVTTSDAGPRFVLEPRDDGLWLVDHRADPSRFPEMTEVAFGRLVCGPRRFLDAPHVLEVHVTHPDPGYREEYARVFGCPVRFSRPWNAMRLAPDLATWPVAHAPRFVFGILTKHADRLLEQLDRRKTVRSRVERLLLPRLHTGNYSAESVAQELGCSRQTLFRRLKSEETTFAEILADLRKEMATDYLTTGRASVNEVAYLLGFSDPASFSRAFKRWTGKNPSEIRRSRPE